MSKPTGIKHFHAHLDVCERCAKQPFNLCAEGLKALNEAAKIENPALQIMESVCVREGDPHIVNNYSGL